MQTTVYVDVLTVLNYAVTALLVVCTAALMGIKLKRRKIVAAALVGSLGSLAIFLPFMGFFRMLALRILLSAAIVLAALPWQGLARFLKGWFVFFAVSFFFAGVMLGIWMLFTPSGMLYYNGVVYFNVRPLTLLISSVAAYLLLNVTHRLSRAGRLSRDTCRAILKLGGKTCVLNALVDTGNSLCEPFSGIPVIICRLDAVRGILGAELYEVLKAGRLEDAAVAAGTRIRIIPYSGVEKGGALPALPAQELITQRGSEYFRTELVYMALTNARLADGCDAILNPDLIGVRITAGSGRTKAENGGVN